MCKMVNYLSLRRLKKVEQGDASGSDWSQDDFKLLRENDI